MQPGRISPLLICNFERFLIGNALLPFLPLYAGRLGANPASMGLYLALSFLMLTAGTLMSGWLSNHFRRRKPLIIVASLLNVPVFLLMAQANQLHVLIVLTMIAWFLSGITIGLVSILVGTYAKPSQRGRIFGMMGMAEGLSQLLGGLVSGHIVDQFGFPALFLGAALVELVYVFSALLITDHLGVRSLPTAAPRQHTPAGRDFALLALSSVLIYTLAFSTNLGRPVVMNQMGFDAIAISSAIAISGLVALPLPFLLGWLSDRIGRQKLLIVCYLLAGIGALMLSLATTLPAFWLSTTLITAVNASRSLGTALTADLVNPEARDVSIARYNSTPWMGGVIGFAAVGIVMEGIGAQATFTAASVLAVFAVWLVLLSTGRVSLVRLASWITIGIRSL